MTNTEKLLAVNLVGEAIIIGLIIRSHNKQLDASIDLKTGVGIFPEEWMGLRIGTEWKECRKRAIETYKSGEVMRNEEPS